MTGYAVPENRKLRLVFMGTPEFAARILDEVLAWEGGEVVAVYCQPDRPCGRGQKCQPGPVKKLALEKTGAPIHQPLNFKDPSEVEKLRALKPDLLLVAAYGLILPQAVLDAAAIMALNVHTSLLPKYRGAAPIQRAVMNGDFVTGVTIMRMDAGMDTGPILMQRSMVIGDADTAGSLHDQLALMGGKLLIEAMERLGKGLLVEIPQDHARATHAPKLTKDEGRITFDRPARQVHAHVCGVTPWPGAYGDLTLPDRQEPLRVTLTPGAVGGKVPEGLAIGQVAPELIDGRLAIACADALYLIPRLTPAGRKPMEAAAFHCGYLTRTCGLPDS